MHIEAFAEGGLFAPARIAEVLRTTKDEVARTVGLGRDALMRADRVQSPKTQKRLREMVEILNRVEPRFGSALMAYAWYRSEPLPGFSGQTAMLLVRSGRADDVLDYIDAVDAGGESGPLAMIDSVPSVRWSSAGGWMPLEAYLRERVELLRG